MGDAKDKERIAELEDAERELQELKERFGRIEDAEWELDEQKAISAEVVPVYLGFLYGVLEEFLSANLGLSLAEDGGHGWPEFSELLQEKKKAKRRPLHRDFSEMLKSGIAADILKERAPYIGDLCLNYKKDFDFFDVNFEFSDDREEFEEELHCFMYLLGALRELHIPLDEEAEKRLKKDLPRPGDARIDYAIMKSIFHSGKMIERFEHEGKERSDKQAQRGSKRSRKHIGYQEVYEAFHRVEWEGLKMIRIGELIESYLLEREERKPKSRRKKSIVQTILQRISC